MRSKLIVILVLINLGCGDLLGPRSLYTVEHGRVYLVSPSEGEVVGVLATGDSIEFLWKEMDGATRYWIQIDDDTTFLTPIVDDSTLTENFYQASLPHGTYYWRVKAGTPYCWSDRWSWVRSFKVAVYPELSFPRGGMTLRFLNTFTLW
ncbi:hypothetical protein DRQ18_07645, partial [bacterium]